MSFRSWWLENQVDGFAIDKDILSDSRSYSPRSCLFVPQWLNSFTMRSAASLGEFPIGVHFDKLTGKFKAQCSNKLAGDRGYIGLFDTEEEASIAWRSRKLELAPELKPKMDDIDSRIYPRIVEIIRGAK